MGLPADGDYNKVPYKTNVPIVFYENIQNENYPLHWHTATEIIMPIKYDYNVYLLKKLYRLRENDILIVPSCELHGITVPSSAKNGKRVILMFEPTLLYSLSGLSGAMSILHNLNLLSPESTPEIYEAAHALLSAAYDEFQRDDTLRNPAMYAKIIDLYITMARYYHGDKNSAAKPNKRQEYTVRLNTVFEYIENNISEELTLERIAGIAHFSKYHFERIFKKYTNASFYQYLRYMRVKKAKSLLLKPGLAITEVAQDAGFESIATFNRVFKKMENCTPSEYKKLHIWNP
jgi:AraC-like DNA-binding protein